MSALFIRHAECEGNLNNKYDPGFSSTLTSNGISAILDTKKLLTPEFLNPDIVYSSPTARTIETSVILFNFNPLLSNEIIECNYGELKNMEKDKNFNWNNFINKPFPKGESVQDVYKRSTAFFKSLDQSKNIVVVTHGVVIASLLNFFNTPTIVNSFPNYLIDNCGFFITKNQKIIKMEKINLINSN